MIEQIAVIAVAGVASAMTLPAIADLRSNAEAVTLRSLAQAASAAMVLNQVGCQLTAQAAVAGKCLPMRNCAEVGELLLAGVPSGYHVPDAALGAVSAAAACHLVQDSNGADAAFVGIAAGR